MYLPVCPKAPVTTERLDRLIAFLTSEISNGCNEERKRRWQIEHADGSYRYKTESQKHDGRTPMKHLTYRLTLGGEPKGQQRNAGQQDRH